MGIQTHETSRALAPIQAKRQRVQGEAVRAVTVDFVEFIRKPFIGNVMDSFGCFEAGKGHPASYFCKILNGEVIEMLPFSVQSQKNIRSGLFHEDAYELYAKARSWNDLSLSYIHFARPLLEAGFCKAALVVAHMSVKAKLKQLYMQLEGKFPPEDLYFDELIGLLRQTAGIDLETELFLNTLQYIAECTDAAFFLQDGGDHLPKMLERVEQTLERLDVCAVGGSVKVRLEN